MLLFWEKFNGTYNLLQQKFWGNRLLDYLAFLAILLGGIFAAWIIKVIVIRRLKKWAEKTAITTDDLIIELFGRTAFPMIYFGVFYLSIRGLQLPPVIHKTIYIIGLTLVTFCSIRFILGLVDGSLREYLEKRRSLPITGVMTLIRALVWGFGIIFFLDNLGFNVAAIIAGLGIGGVAIALASQAILKDLFNYFVILFDRPFETGDFIIIGDYLGVIERIGIKTTRIRSLSGEQLVFSNTDLTDSRIRNYKRMEKRRVAFKIGVTYQTRLAHLKEIPEIIANIIKSIETTAFDRCHFAAYGDFSLVCETVYYILSSDYNRYMDIQQQINLQIMEQFQQRGIEFAYPTQTIFMAKDNNGQPT